MSTFDRLLIANRGEIARRIARSARDMGLGVAAVYTDADAGALFVAEADVAVRIDRYLDGAGIIAAALATGSGAVHPGYGFLSENPEFAREVTAAGLAWVGPTPDAIAAMSDKIEAKKLAVEAGVPTLRSTDDPDEFASIGFPLLIKASAGGGGKGMRIVTEADELPDATAAARREALAGFGDERIFAERYVARSRHIEIQILGDAHGSLVHLGERECSIQRRHQKVVEEAPSPFLTADMRAAMGESALRLAERIGYRSAGTVEFLVDEDTHDYSFLEVNTRLQVEHPVTEEVTGIDLVREQLRIAMGEPLGYTQRDIRISGHAIEARLYAEDPANDYLPAVGTLDAYEPAAEPVVRWDTGVGPGDTITVDFDPMIAKVVAAAPTRSEAAGRLALALERLHLGGTTTNRDLLAAILREPAFLAGDTTTDYLARIGPAPARPRSDADLRWYATAAAMWLQADHRATAPVLATLPSGFRVGRLADEHVVVGIAGEERTVAYRANRDGSFRVAAETDPGAEPGRAVVHRWRGDLLDLEFAGRRRTLRVTRSASAVHLTGGEGTVSVDVLPRFAPPEPEIPGGAVITPMPGCVIELRAGVGEIVARGQVVAVLEAMKMENHLRAAHDGVVTDVHVTLGAQVDKGALLMVIDPRDEDET